MRVIVEIKLEATVLNKGSELKSAEDCNKEG